MAAKTSFEQAVEARLAGLEAGFEKHFPGLRGSCALVLAPGRAELAGNHTDHEGGHVIASALDCYCSALASKTSMRSIEIESEGFGRVSVELSELGHQSEEVGTSAALVRGIASAFIERGYKPRSFCAYMKSEVPEGSGLSSSAAFELAIASLMNFYWANEVLSPSELALISQTAEREWYGKPCGLMDQAASALGSIQHMDFKQAGVLEAEELDFDFTAAGYAHVLVSLGDDHADLTDAYAAIPQEMQAVASAFGKSRLSELIEDEFMDAVPQLRKALGDRAVLRTIHYFTEEKLVSARAEALRTGDIDAFLAYTRTSGNSSALYLQNVSTFSEPKSQSAMLALALANTVLGDAGSARIHGGGFGGSIQAFVPEELLNEFSRTLEASFGEGSVKRFNISDFGACVTWL